MPRFSDIGDTTAVDHRYADKVIIYVEDDNDARDYFFITGEEVREYLEFTAPERGGSGAGPVIERVRTEREKNPRVFGLLDGEAAALFGAVDALLQCTDILFRLDGHDRDGLIFLGQHERENLLLLYGDLYDLIKRDVMPGDIGRRSTVEIHSFIAPVTRRFYRAALLKYASLTLNHAAKKSGANAGCSTIDSRRFNNPNGMAAILEQIKERVIEEGFVTWEELMEEVSRTCTLVRTRFRTENLNAEARHGERLRLADGRSVLNRLRSNYSPTGRWEAQLLDGVVKSGFGESFLYRLRELTAA